MLSFPVMRPYALLAALCLALYLPGIAAIPPLDRDEARFAQATRQMLQTGDFLHIRFQDEARNKKPAGIYWLQALSVSAFSSPDASAIWPYRVPSLLGATAAVLLTFGLGTALLGAVGRPTALAAGVLLATALGLVAEAHIAKTDAALLAAITAGQMALGLAYVRGRAGQKLSVWIPVVFWAAEAVAILLKGPVGPGFALATAAALAIADRDAGWLRRLRPLAGLVGVALVVLPWLIAIEHATAGRFLADSLGHDLLAKLAGGQEGHGAPPLSYLLLSVATFWPGSLLLVPALMHGWRHRGEPVARFLLAWLVPAWAVLELIPTKLPNYALPLYPAVALLAAAVLRDGVRLVPGGWARRADVAVTVLWAVAGIALAVLLVALPLRFGGRPAAIDIAGAGMVLAMGALVLRHRAGRGPTAGQFAAIAIAFAVPAAFGALPGLDRLWVSRAAADLVARHPPDRGSPLVTVGYGEPSLVFLLGTDLRIAAPAPAATALVGGGEALVSGADEAAFRNAVGARGLAARPLGSVAGLDYSNGKHMMLTLYRVVPKR
jgi:4-amino-4-deoxy-L-arabinose transferase-like glycosyltransferase